MGLCRALLRADHLIVWNDGFPKPSGAVHRLELIVGQLQTAVRLFNNGIDSLSLVVYL